MKQREALIVLGALVLAAAISTILLASSLVAAAPANRRIFFDARSSQPPARTVIEAQRDLPAALQPIIPCSAGSRTRHATRRAIYSRSL